MDSRSLVADWFKKWEQGNFEELPLTDDFVHKSPFGSIEGKESYLDLVRRNKDKFLGHKFKIHEGIYSADHASVKYTSIHEKGHDLEVSEWYHFQDGKITRVEAYYHIGDIRPDRKLKGGDTKPGLKKGLLVVLTLLNLVVLLGQLWPEGAPPFARTVNITFLVLNFLFLGWIIRKPGGN